MLKANVLCCGNKVGKGDRRGPWGAGGTGHAPSSLPRSHTGHASSLLTVSPGGRSPGHLPPDGERNPRLQTKQVSGVNQCVCTDARAQRASRALGSRTSVWGPVPRRAPGPSRDQPCARPFLALPCRLFCSVMHRTSGSHTSPSTLSSTTTFSPLLPPGLAGHLCVQSIWN